MKKIKYTLFSAVIFSFLIITSCSTTKSVPSDDVYYSVTPHNNVAARATASVTSKSSPAQNTGTKASGTQAYQEGTVENISASAGQTKTTSASDDYDVDYSARLKRFHDSNDTTLDYYDDYYEGRTMQGESSKSNNNSNASASASVNYSFGLGFGSPGFGSSWSFGFGYPYSSWGLGFGLGWGYPYYAWDYPFYGGYFPPSYGYYPPYYGYYPPSYGYYPPGYGFYPPYYCYYPPYYPGYPDMGNGVPVYQPRRSRTNGSSIPRGGTVAGGSGVYSAPNGKSTNRPAGATVSGKRVPVHPTDHNGKITKPEGNPGRPAGSVRYNAAWAKAHSQQIHNQGKLNKPNEGNRVRKSYEGSKSPRFGVSESRNRGAEGYNKPPAYGRGERMPKPRFEKPKQYQSLESRSPHSSKEFYRTPARPVPSTYRRANVSHVYTRPTQVQHIYRPTHVQHSVYRSRPVRSNVKVYHAPTRSFSSPNTYRVPVRRNSTGTTAPTRSFSAPVRINTSGSGGGSIRRSSGSGGIRH